MVIEYVIQAIFLLVVGLIISFASIKMIVSVARKQVKGDQIKDLMKTMGITKFNIKDLNDLTDTGFQRLLVLIANLKPPSELDQMLQMMQRYPGVQPSGVEIKP